MDCLYECHPGLRACRHALPGFGVHKLVCELWGISVLFGDSVDLLGQPGVFDAMLEFSIGRFFYPQEVECDTLLFVSLLKILFDLVSHNQVSF